MTAKRKARALIIAREEDQERFREMMRRQGYTTTCITSLVGKKIRLNSYAIICIGGSLATPDDAASLEVIPRLREKHEERAAAPLRKAG